MRPGGWPVQAREVFRRPVEGSQSWVCFYCLETLVFILHRLGSIWGLWARRWRRAAIEAGSLEERLWQWSTEKSCGPGNGSEGLGSDWVLAVL